MGKGQKQAHRRGKKIAKKHKNVFHLIAQEMGKRVTRDDRLLLTFEKLPV